MKIWFDIINPSHALFFNSIIKDFKSEDILLTIRARAETVELVKSFDIKGKIIGKYNSNNIKKIIDMCLRTLKLNIYLRDFDIALSFENGMSVLISKLKNKKSILFCDNDLKFKKDVSYIQNLETKIKSIADFVVIPQACYNSFCNLEVKGDIIPFNGFKEDVYIADYTPNLNFFKKIPYKNYIIIRPEALGSFYVHDKQSITPKLLHLFKNKKINIIYLPRDKEDIRYMKGLDIYMPRETLNGLDLVYYADAVLTGSGTMAREAACMGKKAISFFPGNRLLSVDKQLVDDGKIFHSRNPKEIVEYVKSNSGKSYISNFNRSKKVKKEVIKIIKTCIN